MNYHSGSLPTNFTPGGIVYMPRRFVLLSGMSLIGVLILAGCGSQGAASNAAAASGGTVVVAEAPQAPPNWFFPVFSASAYTEINAQIQFLMYPMFRMSISGKLGVFR